MITMAENWTKSAQYCQGDENGTGLLALSSLDQRLPNSDFDDQRIIPESQKYTFAAYKYPRFRLYGKNSA